MKHGIKELEVTMKSGIRYRISRCGRKFVLHEDCLGEWRPCGRLVVARSEKPLRGPGRAQCPAPRTIPAALRACGKLESQALDLLRRATSP